MKHLVSSFHCVRCREYKGFKACALPLGNSPGRKGGQKVIIKFHSQERKVEKEGKVKEQVSVLSDWVKGLLLPS